MRALHETGRTRNGPKISDLRVSAFTVPTASPEADGTYAWNSTTIVVVEVDAANDTGIGYTYADISTAELVNHSLRRIVIGKSALDVTERWEEMVRSIRNLGRPGIASMAISAVDTALWDLKAKLLGLPLCSLFGQVRDSVTVYGSGGFTTYSDQQMRRQFEHWLDMGIRQIKMKIGSRPADDLRRVRFARSVIGPEPALFVDANGAFSGKTALWFAERFAEADVRWFEEPVSSDDLEGLRFVRDRAPVGMDIAAGEYGYDLYYFRRMLDAGAVDVLQADATRCGGYTGFRQADVLCASRNVFLSAHCAPSLHLHVCAAAQRLIHLEYFYDHARIEQIFFEGAMQVESGTLSPDLSRPGIGIELRRADAERYAA